ncbi:MAG: ATP-binding protein, partial [Eubacterium sp.]
MQRVYYNSIETQYENSRRLIHDMKNHIQTLEELYISGNIVEAGKYTSTIYENMDSMGNRFKCKNKILTIIINDKIRKSDKKGIVIKTDIEDINMEFMEPFDMTTIFSNLLDNAIEACEVIENDQKEISIRMFKYKDFMTIKIDNTYDMKIKKDGRLFLSTKEGLHMGLGLKNVESTIQKYDGSIYYNDGKNIFEVKILLPLDS